MRRGGIAYIFVKNVVMYLTETISRSKKKTYQCVLLRESYREGGKVKNRTLANLSHCKPNEIAAWLRVRAEGRTIVLSVDDAAKLDGCYVIKTDLPLEAASREIVHQRYKDLALVERAFRTRKTGHLELRPINVRT